MTEQIDAYTVYEVTTTSEHLVAFFPPDNAQRVIEWGEREFTNFHAAEPLRKIAGHAYLKKEHGITVPDTSEGFK